MTTKTVLATTLSIALGMASQAANAGNQDGQFVIRGIGAQKCSFLNEDFPENKTKQLELSNWVGGYVTYANKTQNGVFDHLPFQNTEQFSRLVAAICRTQAEAQVQSVMDSLITHFEPYHSAEKGSFEVVKSATHQVALRRETVMSVQALLASRGYLTKDDVDGAFGPKSSKAVADFQKAAGIKETGVPDTVTLYRLLSEK
ncbi:peptidoglycan-binding protein [Shimia sp. CNT1-13L.2]|jgi:murein L,D-transpeptidase YcbB/YkuD|uniref:peptidoglycan-binding domain-containing protein n=1 Tax=Shimia sp. CNT1-13L.2 TaxID=2959663 RepID=UPI0020CEF85E|nr:peptidoglycan-binding domain-containing protein [Shimia sp. CNT1-13L.2]MCP9482663.1 peptidoglycan-binding protein [Shimia sp. CNT1-13L.2]